MATSADTLAKIIKELVKKHPDHDYASAVTHLGAKGYLPKKLTQTPKAKKTTRFASKAAVDYAEAHPEIVIPDDFKGTAKHGISVSDLKTYTTPKKAKTNISHTARNFAADNGLDISKVTGTGVDGRILLKDIQALKPSAATPTETKPKVSAKVAKLMKKHRVDEEALVDPSSGIVATGKNGTIIERDIMPYIRALEADEKENPSDPEETEDESSEDED